MQIFAEVGNILNVLSESRIHFYSLQYKKSFLAASDLYHMFTQSIRFYIFYYHLLKVQWFEKCDSSNRQ